MTELDVGRESTEAGGSAIAVSAASGEAKSSQAAPERVALEVLDEDAAALIGASAFAFRVDRIDGGQDSATVEIEIDYEDFRRAFGGDFASRLVVERFPACALETPEVPTCTDGVPLEAVNDLEDGTLTLDVDANPDPSSAEAGAQEPAPVEEAPATGDGQAGEAGNGPGDQSGGGDPLEPEQGAPSGSVPPEESEATTTSIPEPADGEPEPGDPSPAPDMDSNDEPQAEDPLLPDARSVYSVTAGVSGTGGTYAATSLSQSSRWTAGGPSGDATYSYPLGAPSTSVGTTPGLALSYSSGVVDGMTPSENSQPGVAGLGWDITGLGFIERGYRTCGSDGTGWILTDLCWHSDNATISLNGRSSPLVKTPTSGEWRVKDDPGWKVRREVGAPNGAYFGEYWVVTSPDGTQYWFGYGQERNTGTATNSAWLAPVYGNHSGDPCYSGTSTPGYCTQAWRWNLDRIVAPNNTLTTVFWHKETNRYGRGALPSQSTAYDRGGYPASVRYGMLTGVSAAPGRVDFFYGNRCTAAMAGGVCPAMTAANASSYPDVPVDLVCTSTTYCTKHAPSFFVSQRLASVYTVTYSGGTYRAVDQFALTHSMPAPPDGTDAKLWMTQVQQIGDPNYPWVYSGTPLPSPPVQFGSAWLANRADANPSLGVAPADMLRLAIVWEELGGSIWFAYGQPGRPCTDLDGPWDVNTQYCFPVYFDPDTGPPGWAVNNKYVVTTVTQVDGVGPAPNQITNYTYLDAPAWHHTEDPVIPSMGQTWSQWRGHSKIRVTNGSQGTELTYYRGMYGDELIGGGTRTTTVSDSFGFTEPDRNWLAGRLRQTRKLKADGINTEVVEMHAYDGPITAGSGSGAARMINEVTFRTRTTAGWGLVNTRSDTTYDPYLGLPLKIESQGDLAVGGDERCTKVAYTYNLSTWRAQPSRETQDVDCAAPYDRVTDTFYDGTTSAAGPLGHGNPTQVRRYRDATLTDTPSQYVATKASYDGFGRQTSTTTAKLRTTTTAYAPANGGGSTIAAFATAVTVTNPKLYVASTTLDPRRGQAVNVTDPNGRVTATAYDQLGRTRTVALPLDPPTSPSYIFTYGVSDNKTHEARVRTQRRLDGTTYLNSWKHVDGFGRPIESQTHSPSGTGRIATTTSYDAEGNTARTTLPYHANGGPGTNQVNPPAIFTPNDTTYAYDHLGRPTQTTTRAGGNPQWASTTAYDGFSTTSVTPEGRRRASLVNAYGELVRLREQTSGGATYATTEFTVGPVGTLNAITDAQGNVTTYTYDHLGQRVATSDPDTGTSSTTYDDDGNPIQATDGEGQVTATEYDELGRPTARRDGPSPTSPLLASWTYWESTDTPATNRGLPKATTSYDGTDAYVSSIDAYDGAARPVATTLTVPASAGPGLAGTYSSQTTAYTARGDVKSVTLPAVGDLPAETLTSTYTSLGLANGLTGQSIAAAPPPVPAPASFNDTYIANTSYRNDGAITSRILGSSPGQIQRTYTYDAAAQRISGVATGVVGGSVLANDTFQYDDDGNVTQIQDLGPGAGAQRQCFRYDDQSRLADAWTTDTCGDPAAADETIGSDPYQLRYTYDTIGNTTSVTSGTASPSTRAYSYAETSGAGPHAVTTVSSGESGPDTAYTYDDNGAQASKSVGTDTTLYGWDSSRRLASTTEGADTTSSVYDASGNRILRHEPDGSTTLYLGGHEIRRAAGGAVTATRYYGNVAMRNADGLRWLLADVQGSAQLAIDADSPTTVDRQRYLPFGGARGPENQLPTDRDYLGKTKDDTTGLVKMGARYYDPDIGRFISPDPVISLGTPISLNGYAYSYQNPMTLSDPSGLTPCARFGCHVPGGSGFSFGSLGGSMTVVTASIASAIVGKKVGRAGLFGGGVVQAVRPPRGPGLIDSLKASWSAWYQGRVDSLIASMYAPGNSTVKAASYIGESIKSLEEPAGEVIKEVSGYNDLVDCANGSLSGCMWTLVNVAGLLAGGATGTLRAGAKAAAVADDVGDITRSAKSISKAVPGESRTIFRAVEPAELAQLRRTNQYRNIDGIGDGKYFFPTRQQAESFGDLMAKRGMGGPYCVTSGCVPLSALSRADAIGAVGEGPGFYIFESLLPQIEDVRIYD